MFEILTKAGSADGAEDRTCAGTSDGRLADEQPAPQAPAGSNFGRNRGALEHDSENDGSPLEALKRVVRRHHELARRLPAWGPLLFGDPEHGRADDGSGFAAASPFKTIASHVRAAQQSGELESCDAAERITILILGAIVGAVDLAQSGRVTAACAVRELESLPLHLIDRLTVKRFN